eukprot:RCo001161
MHSAHQSPGLRASLFSGLLLGMLVMLAHNLPAGVQHRLQDLRTAQSRIPLPCHKPRRHHFPAFILLPGLQLFLCQLWVRRGLPCGIAHHLLRKGFKVALREGKHPVLGNLGRRTQRLCSAGTPNQRVRTRGHHNPSKGLPYHRFEKPQQPAFLLFHRLPHTGQHLVPRVQDQHHAGPRLGLEVSLPHAHGRLHELPQSRGVGQVPSHQGQRHKHPEQALFGFVQQPVMSQQRRAGLARPPGGQHQVQRDPSLRAGILAHRAATELLQQLVGGFTVPAVRGGPHRDVLLPQRLEQEVQLALEEKLRGQPGLLSRHSHSLGVLQKHH